MNPAAAAPALLAAALLAVGCQSAEPGVEREFPIFGTRARIRLEGPHDVAERAADGVQRELERLDRDWYAWGSGELGALNSQLEAATSAAASIELGELIARAVSVSAASGGRFDPAIGALVEAWGFTMPRRHRRVRPVARLRPPDRRSRSRGARTAMTSAWHDRGTVIDLGGIAKGAALARCYTIMRNAGIRRGLIDLGGDIVVAPRTRPHR